MSVSVEKMFVDVGIDHDDLGVQEVVALPVSVPGARNRLRPPHPRPVHPRKHK